MKIVSYLPLSYPSLHTTSYVQICSECRIWNFLTTSSVINTHI